MKVAFVIEETIPFSLKENVDVFINKIKNIVKQELVDAIVLPMNALEGIDDNNDISLPYYLESLQEVLQGQNIKLIYASSVTNAIYEIFSNKIYAYKGVKKEWKIENDIYIYFADNEHWLSENKSFFISIRKYIFDGQKYVGGGILLSRNNKAKYLLNNFENGYVVVDTSKLEEIILENADVEKFRVANAKHQFYPFDEEWAYNILVKSIKTYFQRVGIKKAVVGLSGGIDSAVVAALGVAALGKENVVGLLMPSEFSTSHSITDAEHLAQNLGIEHHILPIKNTFNSFNETLSSLFERTEFDVTEENIQARIRGTLVMAYANKFGGMVLNTSNKSELMVGYGTLYGDLVGGIGVIGDVFKTEVYRLANYINKVQGDVIPEHILTKAPSAELRPGQKDQDALPDYNVLDKVLITFLVVMNEYKWLTDRSKLAEIIVIRHKDLFDIEIDITVVKHTLKLIFANSYKGAQVPPKIVLGIYPEIKLPLLYKLI